MYTGQENAISRDGQIAIASAIVAFTLGSLLFFVLGFLCRHFAHVCCKPKPLSESGSPSKETPTVPLYDDVIPRQHTQQQLQLNENVAYGTAT